MHPTSNFSMLLPRKGVGSARRCLDSLSVRVHARHGTISGDTGPRARMRCKNRLGERDARVFSKLEFSVLLETCLETQFQTA
mmetsp:Transcript_22968/g.32090  ORF Transcript_22968/g.32090 Transcript_22968/m.32090 type:complete len:82 (+) Transcript_22968:127-372(+)